MEKAQAAFEEEKNQLKKTIFVLEQQCKDQEKAKADLGTHVWNLSEEIKKLKGDIEAVGLDKKSLLDQIEQAKRNEQKLLDDKKNSIMAEQETIEKIKTEHESTKSKNANLIADVHSLRNSLSERESKIGQLEAAIITLEDSLRLEKLSIQTQMNEFSNLLSVSKTKITDLESEVKIAQDKFKGNDAKFEGILSKLTEKESAIESLQFELVVFFFKELIKVHH
jgi:chromosome segregation ATPase